MTAKIKWSLVDDFLISCATQGLFEAATWDALVKDLNTKPIRKYLVATLGTAELTSVQRKQVSEVLVRKKIGVAVVTDQPIVRHLVTAVSWLGVDVRAFPWTEVRQAAQHLGATGMQEERVLDALAELRAACLAKE